MSKQKRGIFQEQAYAAPEYLAAAPLAQAPLAAAPLEAAHFHATSLPSAHFHFAPVAAAASAFPVVPTTNTFATVPTYEPQSLLAAQQLPFKHEINPIQPFAAAYPPVIYALQAAPDQVQTIIKKIAVPQERIIPIDNPIYTPVERPIPIDNPVPVLKLIEQPVPVHVDHPIVVPVVKEIHVPQPFVHKVKLILQKVFVKQPAARAREPARAPAPQKTIIIQEIPRQHGWE